MADGEDNEPEPPSSLQTVATSRQRGRGGSLEIFLNHRAPAANKPILLFHHIRKTAGTSVRKFFRLNLSKSGDHLYVDAPESQKQLKTWHEDFYASWTDDERARATYIAGHSGNYFLPLLTRPVRAFSIVREPLDRTLSRYFFMKDRDWDLEQFVSDGTQRARVSALVNGQSISLLQPHFDISTLPETADSEDADTWVQRLTTLLDETYTLGVQDQFEWSIAMFAHALGFKRLANPQLRVNSERPKDPDIASDVVERLSELNWLDHVLYAHASTGLQRFADAHPEALARKRGKGDEGEASRAILAAIERLGDDMRIQLAATATELSAIRDRLDAIERGGP